MKSVQAIERWITAIESSKQEACAKEQQIKAIVDLWKFAYLYDQGTTITQKGELQLEDSDGRVEKISVATSDLFLTPKENAISKILSEIETEFSELGDRYRALYNVEFRNPEANFDAAEILKLKSEIISGIKGEVILYKYVERIRKLPSSEFRIVNRDFRILECSYEDIQSAIDQNYLLQSDQRQWLVIVLSAVDNNCRSFLIDETIKTAAFSSGFEKIFLFDFYTSEIIELNIKAKAGTAIKGVPLVASGVA
ncbi:MAG: hypothetical protein JNM71_02320 [Flavobacterium lindanitolerans]|uniref:hypothetical protein n=1 Tax=Flavobacterium lindanitolerans TaxID=428988 RepID=UPI001A38F8B4|nr:hypothetical protein [Flavobacterium lindanitolerans]MBL7866834.1 hypothetical protein [Flavobacterium lindanitolerans]